MAGQLSAVSDHIVIKNEEHVTWEVPSGRWNRNKQKHDTEDYGGQINC